MININYISFNPIRAFDANLDYTFTFNYGGNQSVRNQLVVYNALNGSIIYDSTIATLKLAHTLPAHTLSNGNSYQCTISAFDISGNFITTTKVHFLCLATPMWGFSNLSEYQVIKNMDYTVNIDYSQAQNELLNEYNVILYSSSSNVIWDSGVKYSSTSLSVNISGLSDNTLYYIRAVGKTVNDFSLDTGLIPFSVEYVASSLVAALILENKEHEGLVKISSNIVLINGISEPDEPVFINDAFIDLNDNRKVTFDKGFSITGDYLLAFQGYNFEQNKPLLALYSPDDYPTFYWRTGVFDDELSIANTYAFVELVISGNLNHIIISNKIPIPIDADMIHVWVRRVKGFYEIKIANKG